jgi:hypothetical protein
VVIAAFLSLLCGAPVIAQETDWRTIEFETTEVTGANVTVSPDGQWLIFTILGHLFRLPVGGGTAEQLTFGPSYDTGSSHRTALVWLSYPTETGVTATSSCSSWKARKLHS